MEPYIQKWPRLITVEEWLALAHEDILALPWIADNGAEVCSFTVKPFEHAGAVLVLLYDAHDREVVRARNYTAIAATAMALGAKPNELTFLPAPVRV
jgi:hypothetical protein